MIIENETPTTGTTIRITPVVPHTKDALLGLALVLMGAVLGAAMFGASMFTIGWEASVVYRTIQPYTDQRGWIALLFIAISVPMITIWRSNLTNAAN